VHQQKNIGIAGIAIVPLVSAKRALELKKNVCDINNACSRKCAPQLQYIVTVYIILYKHIMQIYHMKLCDLILWDNYDVRVGYIRY